VSTRYALATTLPDYLRQEQQRIESFARDFGLDFFPTVFEVLSYDQMNEIAAYGGFPTRYPHWRFGMEYERLSKSYEYGLSKIYEMVINNNPAVAYLLEGNSMVDQKLVMAHVYAHVDFFKNNFTFQKTNQGTLAQTGEPIRKWVDTLANHGAVVRRWANRIGKERVEEFVDICLSLENLIDPRRSVYAQQPVRIEPDDDDQPEESEELPRLRVDKEYMEHFINTEAYLESQQKKRKEEREKTKRFPVQPERDVLLFLINNAPLERWERDIISVMRQEAYYFAPQGQTKIMNEGWATYWHSRLMTEKVADSSEIIDYADRCAGVLATSQGSLNPYKLGVELFRHIEERWNRGQFGKVWEECDDLGERRNWNLHMGKGREKIFEVRKLYNDVTFIDEFLTPDFVAEQKMYAFGYNPRNDRWEIETRMFQEVKNRLLDQLTNAGNPIINVEDANYGNRAELFLSHEHHGVDLRLDYAREVLRGLERIWRRPVQIRTIVEAKPTLLRYDGRDHTSATI